MTKWNEDRFDRRGHTFCPTVPRQPQARISARVWFVGLSILLGLWTIIIVLVRVLLGL